MFEGFSAEKISIVCAAIVGGLMSRLFVDMTAKKFMASVVAGGVMAYMIGEPISDWVGLQPELSGFLVGLFGIAICQLIFQSLKNSDLSVKFSDIAAIFIKRGQ